jgi:hypothetical protein
MSLRALLAATRDTLRAALELDETGCEVCPDGRPHPAAGEWFVAVHPGGLTNQSTLALDERADLLVTVTRRVSDAPHDRIGENAVLDADGVLAKAEAARASVHMNYALMDAANAAIDGFGTTANGYVEPLAFQSLRYLGEKGPEWFFAEGGEEAACGLAVELAFGRARRVQYIGGQT